jgi:HK97 family phage portal protein
MGLLDRIARRAGFEKIQDVKQPLSPWLSATAAVEQNVSPNLTSMSAQEDLFNKLSWVSIAINHVAEQVALNKFNVDEIKGDRRESIVNHPFEMLLERPNPAESRFELIKTTVANTKLTGNGYWWLNMEHENAEPDEIWSIPSSQMIAIPDEKMYIKGYKYVVGDGQELFLKPWEVAHFKMYNPKTRYYGQSQISQIAKVAIGDLGMQDHNTKLFTSKGGRLDTILAFPDAIHDTDWEKLKKQVKDSSEKRSIMMLRGTGEGGVNFVVNGMSQKDMEFLAGRKANKEEIYDWLAPGLSSWLSVNSTEANSKTGKMAFMELAVHPMSVQIGEKITNDILPIYGDNLKGAFEDARVNDTLLELQEQKTYAITHTVDEVREKYYNDKPIGDERGELLPAEVTTVIKPETQDASVDEASTEINDTVEKMLKAQKESERKQYRNYVKARKTGEGFEFFLLSEDEQTVLKAETMGIDQLTNAIDDMRKAA